MPKAIVDAILRHDSVDSEMRGEFGNETTLWTTLKDALSWDPWQPPLFRT
jgi:hypothetical protein